jgi:tripartite-type tricarboxylate transporter receptor subunit TctC
MQGALNHPVIVENRPRAAGTLGHQSVAAAAAPSPAHSVPGHDPLVMKRYPAPRPELQGIVVRLDVKPKA